MLTVEERGFYNAAADLLERNLGTGALHTAFVDDYGAYTYAQVADRVDRFAGALGDLGIAGEQRILLVLLDTVDFPTAFLGAIKFGAVPVAANTLLGAGDLAYMLEDCRAKLVVASAELLTTVRDAIAACGWKGKLIVSDPGRSLDGNVEDTMRSLLSASPQNSPANTRPDDPCFWLYSSGSTGKPKGTIHAQTSMVQTAELFAQGVLGMTAGDTVYSSAKLFFAYGLGNALSFPMNVGATSVLRSGRVTPDLVFHTLRDTGATIFCGVPTLFAAMLAHPDLPARSGHRLRICTSAGEALPAHLGETWSKRTGVDIVDGIGSTEMLHIFVSNSPDAVRYGTTGKAVNGYRVRIVDENRNPVARGEVGDLEVAGPTSALGYWNNRERSRSTFLGEWTRSGDKFYENDDGDLVHCGRSDDMLKVSGMWVSPGEVEAALITHESVLEAAVIGVEDEKGLIKPKAFVVLKPNASQETGLTEA
ncbi:MAG: benzoate-CoA ligase family protein, partial [Vulcanimicrobiaceae bacterium]